MNKKQFIIATFSFLLLLGGLGAAILVVGQKQLPAKRAATSTGTAQVRLNPETATVTSSGATFQVQVPFTTGGSPISAVTIQLDFAYTGAEPPFEVSSVTPDATLLQTGSWSFPIKSFSATGGTGQIKIAAINTSTTGFNAPGETMLATLTFKATNTPGTANVTFDSTQSKVTRKDTGADTLLIPTSTGTYIFSSGSNPTATPTPAGGDSEPTPTPTTGGTNPTSTPTPTPTTGGNSPTATPTPRPSGSTPTPKPTMPVSGSFAPTASLALVGAMMLFLGLGSVILLPWRQK